MALGAFYESVESERTLVAELRSGEPGAFDVVYERYRQRIFGFLVRLSGRRDLAEDLFQETWLSLARHAPKLAEDTDLAAWLFTVARNRYRSHRRWAVLDGERLRALGLTRANPPLGDDASDAASDLRRLAHALHQLSPSHREVILLAAVEELPQEQVATILGIRPDAVRQRLSRARAELRLRLALPRATPLPARTAGDRR